jgi:hypothetical protein
MKYHKWTREERERVAEYVDYAEWPLSPLYIDNFAKEIGVSVSSARGAVSREMARRRRAEKTH